MSLSEPTEAVRMTQIYTDARALMHIAKRFDPNQPRDEYGRWNESLGVSSSVSVATFKPDNYSGPWLPTSDVKHLKSFGLTLKENLDPSANGPPAYYDSATKSIEVTPNPEPSTVAHELGHAMDHSLGWISQTKEFRAIAGESGVRSKTPSALAEFYARAFAGYVNPGWATTSDTYSDSVMQIIREARGTVDSLGLTRIPGGWKFDPNQLRDECGRWTTNSPAPYMEQIYAASRALMSIAKRFDPNQQRDEYGRWSATGGGSSNAQSTFDTLLADSPTTIDSKDMPELIGMLRDTDKPVNISLLHINNFDHGNMFDKHETETPRDQMPQIPADAQNMDGFMKLLGRNGIGATMELIAPQDLHATQNQLDGHKAAKIAAKYDPEKMSVMFTDKNGAVLDGHHRWAAGVMYSFTNPNYKLRAMRIDTDIHTLLKLAEEYDKQAGVAHSVFGGKAKAGEDIWNLPPTSEPKKELGLPATKPCPDVSKPYVWFDGDWYLVEVEPPKLTDEAKELFREIAVKLKLKFDPSEPRDQQGRWTEHPGGNGTVTFEETFSAPATVEGESERALRSLPMETPKELNPGGAHINLAVKVHLKGDGNAVVKPVKGAHPIGAKHPSIPWDRDPEAEAGAYLVAKRLGVNTPAVVVRDVDFNNYGHSSVQEWRDFDEYYDYDLTNGPEGRRGAIFDVLIGNLDRHQGQMGVDSNGKLLLMDHGFSFPDHLVSDEYEWKNDVLGANFYGEMLTMEERRQIESLNTPEMEKELKDVGLSDTEIGYFKDRVKTILDTGTIESTGSLDERSHTYSELQTDAEDARARWDEQEASEPDWYDPFAEGYEPDDVPDEEAMEIAICNKADLGYKAETIANYLDLDEAVVREAMDRLGYPSNTEEQNREAIRRDITMYFNANYTVDQIAEQMNMTPAAIRTIMREMGLIGPGAGGAGF